MAMEIWKQPEIANWSQLLLDSYYRFFDRQLVEREGDLETQAKALFLSNFVVVSHGREENPILNYGNQVALNLWEMDWHDFTRTPSRQTAEPVAQEERQEMLARAANQGFITNYQGVRISSTGKRFLIKEGTIWNLKQPDGSICGQAATFSNWVFLDDPLTTKSGN